MPRQTNQTKSNPSFAREAPVDCRLCPRLAAFRDESGDANPDWFNGAVPSFGPDNARLLIVGLAPGLKGANRTGRPFTGDYAGDLLYATLDEFGFSKGQYAKTANDGLKLRDCMITNAVRCVPPQNKPTPEEIKTCRGFFQARISALPNLKVLLALGRIAHDQTLATFGLRKASYPFAHGAAHELMDGLTMFDSFHCSRYNTNTGRLTEDMFRSVFADIQKHLERK
ncbi:MAG: uracil-DNA glycosylase [Hyphomicrobiaceae bacterium]